MRPTVNRICSLVYSLVFRGRQVVRYFGKPGTWKKFGAAAKVYDCSIMHVAFRALHLYMKDRLSPDDVLERGLADPEWSVTRLREHLCDARLHGLQGKINTELAAVCRDKLLFHSHCRAHGLPVPSLYAVLSAYGSRTAGREPVPLASEEALLEYTRDHLPDRVVIKPRMGNMGRDVFVLNACAGNEYEYGEHGPRAVDFYRRLFPGGDDWLLEQALSPHPDIATLTGRDVISSVRVFTFIEDGVPEVVDAYFRIVVGSSFTDNISASDGAGRTGNILGSVDVNTGRVIDAFRPSPTGIGMEQCPGHPDTGHALVGFNLPDWEAAMDVTSRAARAFLPIMTIGWDVAITSDGPVLIEANEKYQHAGIGAGPERVRKRLEHLEFKIRATENGARKRNGK